MPCFPRPEFRPGRNTGSGGEHAHMSLEARTQRRFGDALDEVLEAHASSYRDLGRRLGQGADPTFLIRTRRGDKPVPPDLPRRIAEAFGLPDDYFVETREDRLCAAIRRDADLRERLYDELRPGSVPMTQRPSTSRRAKKSS